MTTNNDQLIKHLVDQVRELKQQVEFLKRENSRRKSEINQVISAIRKG
jgi:hypothetical protein